MPHAVSRPARRFALLAVSSAALLASAPAIAQSTGIQTVHISVGPGGASAPIRVTSAPPAAAPAEAARPPAPSSGAVWVPGSWGWNGGGYAWNGGQWSTPPSYGASWIPPRWENHDGYVLYYPGYWSQGPVNTYNTYTGYNSYNHYPPYNPYPNFNAYSGTPYAIGGAASGTLYSGLPSTSSGTLFTDYAVNLYAGQPVTLVVRGGPSWTSPGGQLDPLMQVIGNGSILAQDDDGAGGMDSRIVFTPAWTGTFIVRVTTYGVGPNQGSYTLSSRYGVGWM